MRVLALTAIAVVFLAACAQQASEAMPSNIRAKFIGWSKDAKGVRCSLESFAADSNKLETARLAAPPYLGFAENYGEGFQGLTDAGSVVYLELEAARRLCSIAYAIDSLNKTGKPPSESEIAGYKRDLMAALSLLVDAKHLVVNVTDRELRDAIDPAPLVAWSELLFSRLKAPWPSPSPTPRICAPGERRCLGDNAFEVCSSDGMSWYYGSLCPYRTRCVGGECA